MLEDEVREVKVVEKDHARPIGHHKDHSFYFEWFYKPCRFEQSNNMI